MAANPTGSVLAEYPPPQAAVDEMLTADGALRTHWRYLVRALDALGPAGLGERSEEARRVLAENGVSYTVYGDPHGLERPWPLDPVPLLIPSEEWARTEAGLTQRAELLNLIFKDLYGPRELLRRGILPPELIYAHAGFLRPCAPLADVGAHALIFYAADLARGADGQVWVMSDRTQSPSGAGYALANRVAMTRIFPSLFRDSHVHRLALFFQNLRASLAALSPRPGEEPHIVVLTPGPRNETYFEHSYLASYLGYTLARGDDLTVRDGRVWLRSMGRLQPVDVILRRVDDDYCDPLELRADSRLGVPGLAEVVRRGNVVVANPLGAGALENPGLNAFLPAIARHFLGQDLLLPSAPSWWCGQARERDYVLANLQRLVIKPIHREPGMQPVFGARLSAAEREALAGRIRAQPHRYVGQEQLACSVAPALVDGRLEPRPLIQRGFLVAREDGYVVLPGGLARSAPATDSWIVSNQAGAVSKDTWVLATEPEKQTSLLQTPLTEPQRSEPPLASATADNAFWLGRYAERAEQGLRSLRVVLRAYRQAEEYGNPRDRRALEPLLETLTFTLGAGPGFLGDEEAARALRAEPRGELQALLCDPQRVGSVAQNLHGMLEAAFATRDRLSADAWRIIGDLRLRLDNLAADPPEPAAALRETLDPLLTELMALVGIGAESTVRSQAWRFLDIGRRIERALQVGALTQALLGPARDEVLEQALLDALLQATDSGVGYRRVHADQLAVSPVLRWVLQESTNPRALGYQLERLRGQLEGLPRDPDEEARSRELRLLVDAHARLFLAEPAGLADAPQGYRGELQGLLFGIAESLRGVSDALTLRYFVDMRGPQQLNAPGGSR